MMTSAFSAVNLALLTPPDAVEALDFETIFSAMLADLRARDATFSALVESDPAIKILEVAAYRELILRQRINDAVKAVMPAYAIGSDLDHIAALFGVARLTITPADPDTGAPAVMEGDDDFRRRLVLAPEGYSVAGPEGAYIFHALTADADVLDASVTSPEPGEVLVSILSRTGNGEPAPEVVAAVADYLANGDVRPLTDHVTVQAAAILNYAVQAQLITFAGPDASVVVEAARARLEDYVAQSHRLGRDVTLSGLYAALHVEGVQKVVLIAPLADIPATVHQAAYCTGIALTHAGIGE
ncbi:baseplate assembly protein [Sphingopyxis sp.]|uniref:baseplate assembly protein n=1 Tax=Sphingopyxis sp. TaxID=1908224 RepID=UPI004036CCD0